MKEAGIDYRHGNLQACGNYDTQAELEATCASNANCVGYSMHNADHVSTTPDADGYKPWCMKRSHRDRTVRLDHNHYRKSSCKGKKDLLSTFIKPEVNQNLCL